MAKLAASAITWVFFILLIYQRIMNGDKHNEFGPSVQANEIFTLLSDVHFVAPITPQSVIRPSSEFRME